ncbi:probable terpene synthase 9 [Humulus lupulus]|uniref:probable terpene synthase 9 n=1 Tax=Humulus lupulus TaxID=3486 RepID=UPI002B4027D1|nr:probable terpene synthase 9 [Humulus lupulus]
MSSTLSFSFTTLFSLKPISPSTTRKNQVLRSKKPSFKVIFSEQRRSASYHPTIWETKLIDSFFTPYNYELHSERLEELKQLTRSSLRARKVSCTLLKLIDSIQRLGVEYHFENEIEEAVSLIYADDDQTSNLYITALRFRLLRQHGLFVGSDVFDKFRGKDGRFLDSLSSNVHGILSLYEASHLGMPEENVLEEAKSFTTKMLKYFSAGKMDSFLSKQVEQSLEVPLYWRMPRFETRNFIDLYQMDETKSATLLELAQLDYNLVQSLHQNELKELGRWWRDLGFKESLPFARDRVMENYLWALGMLSEPHFSKCRIGLTKFVCILTAIEDVYDIYGSLDELELFTNAVNSWDIMAIRDEFPLYMKICYLGMLNFGNELIYDVLKYHGLNIFPYIKEEWLNLCKSYLIEARWFYSEYTPSLDEYLKNSSTSVGGHAALVHACILLLDCPIGKTSLDYKFNHFDSELIYWSSLITRLGDDLGTSKDEIKRGDVKKSVECYMAEKGTSEEEAIKHIKELRSNSWKMVNKEIILCNNCLPKSIVKICLNMARTAQFIFQHGDGIGTSTGVTKDRLTSLIVKPCTDIQTNGVGE